MSVLALSVSLCVVAVALAVPLHHNPNDGVAAIPPVYAANRRFKAVNATLRDDTFSPLDMIGQFCQGTGDVDQCGANNCECWSTGSKSAGSNSGRIYCNDQGYFCWSDGTCYPYTCMDKDPGTKVLDFSYAPEQSEVPAPEAIFVHYVDNFTNDTVTGNFQWQEQVQTQYQWSWSVTTSVSVSLESTVGLPDVCSDKDTVTTSVSTTTGQTQTNTNTKTWSAQQDYSVMPQSTLKLVYIVSQTKYTVPYTQTVQFGGQLGLWCSDSVNGHHFWMPWAGSILDASPLCNGNVCSFSGTFTGIQGVSDLTTYQYCPLGVHC